MTIHLHLLNARGKLTPVRERVESAFAQGVTTISALLPIADIDVVVQATAFVIPETGIAGYTPAADTVYITIDPANPHLWKDFNTEFLATLGHELHHCLRIDGPGYGRILGEVLVSEGLACHFETELRGDTPPFYACALDNQALEAMRARANAELTSTSYNRRTWLFGSAEQGMPRHTGYSLGFSIVAQYIGGCGTPASRLWDVPAAVFYGTA
jgi:hypothetical protein